MNPGLKLVKITKSKEKTRYSIKILSNRYFEEVIGLVWLFFQNGSSC